MDQIFDRLERLFKSWVTPETEEPRSSTGGNRRYGDPDLNEAMDELDDFLDADRAAAELRQKARLEREAKARAQAEAARGGAGGARQQGPSGPNPRLVAAYTTLGLPFGAPLAQIKAAYKKLLMQHHPDRHHTSPGDLKKATEVSAKINAAYQLLEVYTATGKVPEA